jgi:hypothetical protein
MIAGKYPECQLHQMEASQVPEATFTGRVSLNAK